VFRPYHFNRDFTILVLCIAASPALMMAQPTLCNPSNTVNASVVALDQVIMYNRLGTAQPLGLGREAE